jgi:hypothetical protein
VGKGTLFVPAAHGWRPINPTDPQGVEWRKGQGEIPRGVYPERAERDLRCAPYRPLQGCAQDGSEGLGMTVVIQQSKMGTQLKDYPLVALPPRHAFPVKVLE